MIHTSLIPVFIIFAADGHSIYLNGIGNIEILKQEYPRTIRLISDKNQWHFLIGLLNSDPGLPQIGNIMFQKETRFSVFSWKQEHAILLQ